MVPSSTSPESTSASQTAGETGTEAQGDNVVEEISKLLASDKVMEKDDDQGLDEDKLELDNLLKNLPLTDGGNEGNQINQNNLIKYKQEIKMSLMKINCFVFLLL